MRINGEALDSIVTPIYSHTKNYKKVKVGMFQAYSKFLVQPQMLIIHSCHELGRYK
jgi:hypothetical protein